MSEEKSSPAAQAEGRGPPHRSEQPKVIDSHELFASRREVLIRHQDELYRLRITRKGKLILHK